MYIVFGQKAGRAHGATASTWELIVAALLTVPIGIVDAGARLIDPAILPVGVAVAIFSSALPCTLEMFALRRLSTKTFGTLMSFEPAIAAIAGTVLLKEHLSNTQWSAIALVVVASAGAVTGERPDLATERADLGIVRVRRPTSSTAPSTSCRIVTTAASQEMRRDVSAETYWAPWSSSSTPPSGAAGSPSLVGSPSCPGEASPLTCTTTNNGRRKCRDRDRLRARTQPAVPEHRSDAERGSRSLPAQRPGVPLL